MVQAIRYPHPDAKRIAGYSVAIAFNALLLMLIMVPMQGPEGFRLADDPTTTITWYLPERKPVEVPVVPAPPDPQPPQVRTERSTEPVIDAPVLVDEGTLPPPVAEPIEVASIDVPTITPPAISRPLPGVRLEYLQAPPPAYPRASAARHSEGTVLLEVLVDVDGRPLRVEVREGSGDRRLDAAAREQVMRHWRFRPALQDGQAVQAIGLVPIEFKLR